MTGLTNGDVSRETCARLERYADLLKKWNPRINLVGRATLARLWDRHFRDSAQLLPLAPTGARHWVDLGAGGGFPGLVIAILSMEQGIPEHVTLIESDARKAAFLRTVIRETAAPAAVVIDRVENAEPQHADVLSARALAPLPQLLSYAERHLSPAGIALLPKGKTWKKELEDARRQWSFHCEVVKSETDDDAVILNISGVSPCLNRPG